MPTYEGEIAGITPRKLVGLRKQNPPASTPGGLRRLSVVPTMVASVKDGAETESMVTRRMTSFPSCPSDK